MNKATSKSAKEPKAMSDSSPLEESVHRLMDEGMSHVPAIAGRLMSIHGDDIDNIDSMKDLIGTVNRAKQTYSTTDR